MTDAQKFIEVDLFIKPEDFEYVEERGLYCLNKKGSSESCSDGIATTKGRSIGMELSKQTDKIINSFYYYFDLYLAQQTGREKFSWM